MGITRFEIVCCQLYKCICYDSCMQIIVYIFDNSTVRTSNYGLFSDLYWLNNQAKKKSLRGFGSTVLRSIGTRKAGYLLHIHTTETYGLRGRQSSHKSALTGAAGLCLCAKLA